MTKQSPLPSDIGSRIVEICAEGVVPEPLAPLYLAHIYLVIEGQTIPGDGVVGANLAEGWLNGAPTPCVPGHGLAEQVQVHPLLEVDKGVVGGHQDPVFAGEGYPA